MRDSTQKQLTDTVVSFFLGNQDKCIEYDVYIPALAVETGQSHKRIRKILDLLIASTHLELNNGLLKAGPFLLHKQKELAKEKEQKKTVFMKKYETLEQFEEIKNFQYVDGCFKLSGLMPLTELLISKGIKIGVAELREFLKLRQHYLTIDSK